MPHVFRYSDYRAYLKDWFNEKKKKNPAFSLRSFSKRGHGVPHSTFWMVMRGERNLTASSLKQFVSVLQLEGQAALYFELLVLFNQARKWEFKQRHLQRIVEMHQTLDPANFRKLTNKTELSLYSTWYTIPILVMVELEDFKSDPVWIGKKLGGKVSVAEVRSAIDELLVARFLTLNDGRLSKLHVHTDMDESMQEHMTEEQLPPTYFAEMSRRAADASRLPRSLATGSAGTVMARKQDIPWVRQKLHEAITEICSLLDKHPGPKEVFQVSATFFPLLEDRHKTK